MARHIHRFTRYIGLRREKCGTCSFRVPLIDYPNTRQCDPGEHVWGHWRCYDGQNITRYCFACEKYDYDYHGGFRGHRHVGVGDVVLRDGYGDWKWCECDDMLVLAEHIGYLNGSGERVTLHQVATSDLLIQGTWMKDGDKVFLPCPRIGCGRILDVTDTVIYKDKGCYICTACDGHFWAFLKKSMQGIREEIEEEMGDRWAIRSQ